MYIYIYLYLYINKYIYKYIKLFQNSLKSISPLAVFWIGRWKLPNYTRVSHISWIKAYSVQLLAFYLQHFIVKITQQLSLAEKYMSQLLACQISYVPLRYTTVHFMTLPSVMLFLTKLTVCIHALFP